MFSIKPVPDIFVIWVKLVQNYICIGLMTGSKGNNFKVFGHSLQKRNSVRTDSNESLSDESISSFYWEDGVKR
jgi:hypothetical protein